MADQNREGVHYNAGRTGGTGETMVVPSDQLKPLQMNFIKKMLDENPGLGAMLVSEALDGAYDHLLPNMSTLVKDALEATQIAQGGRE